MSKIITPEWQIALNDFNAKKLKEPVFITTNLDHQDAQALLEVNNSNRQLSERLVKRYMREIEKGLWLLNGETIKVSYDGNLMDGQHRLEAILRSGDISLRTAMAIGVEPKAFTVTDTGKSRSSADILKIAGYKNVTANAAAVRYLLAYIQNEAFNTYLDLTPNNILQGIIKYPQIPTFVVPSRPFVDYCAASLIQFFMYVTQTIDPEASYMFFYKFETGEKLTKNSPILKLRDTLQKYRSKRLMLDKRHVVAMLFQAWNGYYGAVKIDDIRWDGKDFPVLIGIDRKKLFKRYSGLSDKNIQI